MIIKNTFILAAIQCIVGVMAIPAGVSFILQPDGTGLGMTTEVLNRSPFTDFLVPGIFLALFNGIFHVIGSVLTYKKLTTSGFLGLCLGVFLVLWICIQVYYIGLIHFLQPLFLLIGMAEIYFSFKLMTKY